MPANLFKRILDKLPISIIRHVFNFWPPFRGARIKVNYITKDYRIFKASMKLGLLNRNYIGVHYGGSLFSMADPFFLIILIKNLGNQYIVWDKAAKIEFKKPGRGTVSAHFEFSENELSEIRNEANRSGKYIFDRSVNIIDENNEIVAIVTKTMYVRLKQDRNKTASDITIEKISQSM